MGRRPNPDADMPQPGAQPGRLLLHACCAPCSGAILEWLLGQGWRPTLFFCNPNIHPHEELKRREAELQRHAQRLGLEVVTTDDSPADHELWRAAMQGLEHEPERGARCERCFAYRLERAARWGEAHGFSLLATTLASSRWKSLDQIGRAGMAATEPCQGISFWQRNWRAGGLQARRDALVKELGFYNQQYCGCEFSMRKPDE